MTATPNNGIAVRGLRVLRSSEYRRVAWWSVLLGAVLGDGTVHEDDRTVLTVIDGHGTRTLARRRFDKVGLAEAARTSFVERVADMSQPEYEFADWQQVLDDA